MTLKADLAQDMVSVFLATDEFAETITYVPQNDWPREIPAQVYRDAPMPTPDAPRGQHPSNVMEIRVANDATNGVTSVKAGFDKVKLRKHLSDANPMTFVVTKILSQDDGEWRLEVQA